MEGCDYYGQSPYRRKKCIFSKAVSGGSLKASVCFNFDLNILNI